MSSFILDPRLRADTIAVADFQLSRLLLMNERKFPWFILVPRQPNLRELVELDDQQQMCFMQESNAISQCLLEVFAAEKLNIAALGNVVSQLHVHHVARFKSDLCWPNPIWAQFEPEAYSSSEIENVIAKTKAWFDRAGLGGSLSIDWLS